MNPTRGAQGIYPLGKAVPADAAIIQAIQRRAFAAEARLSEKPDIPPLAEDVAATGEQIRTQTVLTARDGERVIGSARGVVEGTRCRICRVSVESSHQGRRIGAALQRAVEQAHPEAERFVSTTNTLLPGNVAFYERRGYQVTELTRYDNRIGLAQLRKGTRLESA